MNIISRPQRFSLKNALAEWLATENFSFHVVAELPPPATRATLNDALYAWAARVNRYYLGRNWASPHLKQSRMSGIIFYEGRGGYLHAHLLVRLPEKAWPIHFQLHARYWFQPYPIEHMRRCYPTPVAPRGRMHVKRIGSTATDHRRVSGYAAKALEWSLEAIEDWIFLDELTPRQVA